MPAAKKDAPATPTPAFSTTTNTQYESWEQLLAAEANGFVVVAILQRTAASSGRSQIFARTIGPFTNRAQANTRAARLRRRFRPHEDSEPIKLLSVNVEPLWKDLDLRP